MSGHDSGSDSMEVPTIYMVYVLSLCKERSNARILKFPLKTWFGKQFGNVDFTSLLGTKCGKCVNVLINLPRTCLQNTCGPLDL